MKLKNRFLICLFLLFIFPLLIFLMLFTNQNRVNSNIRNEEIKSYLSSIYNEKLTRVENHLNTLNKISSDVDDINDYTAILKEFNNDYEDVFYIDYSGPEIITSNRRYNELIGIFQKEEDENTPVFISEPYKDSVSGETVVTFLKKSENTSLNSKIFGITISKKNLNLLGGANSNYYYLIKDNGEILATNNVKSTSFYSMYGLDKDIFEEEKEGSFRENSNNQNKKFRYQILRTDSVYLILEDSSNSNNKKEFIVKILYIIVPFLLFALFIFVFYKVSLKLISKFINLSNNIISTDKNSNLIEEIDGIKNIEQKFEQFLNNVQKKRKRTDENIKEISKKTYVLSKNQNLNYEILAKEQIKMKYIKEEVGKLISLSENNSEELENLIKECEHIVKENKNITLMTESLRRSFHKLSDSSVNIEEMIDNISLISDRTNLLSLNARKEAERVSEYGESYSIIAEEIRNLSILILETSEKAGKISHNVIERIMKSNQVMDLTISKISKLQEEIKKVDTNVKLLYENVHLENIEENELNKAFNELEILILEGRDKLINNINIINELNTFFEDIRKLNVSAEKRE